MAEDKDKKESESTERKPIKVYPIRGRFLHDHPAAVHEVATKKEAAELEASGAFTTNPNHSDRDSDAQDLTAPAPEKAEVPLADRPAGLRGVPDEGTTEPSGDDKPA